MKYLPTQPDELAKPLGKDRLTLFSKRRGVSIASCRGERDECKRTAEEASKQISDDIKTGRPPRSGKSIAATY